ncbi:MAG: hypothetical protein KBI47_08345 [Armatimonadetes bacterium]|jgi:hypothetical protein|nr:hypothetical protein [Armatimonadota bacterium]
MTRSIAVGLIALALAPTGLWADGLAVRNGWLTHEGKAVWGWVQHNGWWRAGMRANITRRSVGDPCGDVRPNRTEDLDKLTDSMLKYAYPGFEHNYGLWYDRRRNAHDEGRRTNPEVRPPFLEQPWARSDQGTAWDGGPKYDLTQFNPWYFQRLEEFAELCDRKGTVLLHKYHMQHALLETPAHYVDFPWRPVNCIQDTGMPDRIPAANVFYDVTHPVRRELHRAYIRRCLEALGRFSNVVHLVAQEYTGPRAYQEFWLNTIVEWERETGNDVLIGLSGAKDVVDDMLADPVRAVQVDVLDLRCWWVTAAGELKALKGGEEVPGRWTECGFAQAEESSPERIYRKVREYRDRYPKYAIIDAMGQDRRQSWAFLMAGGSLLVAGQIQYPEDADPPDYVKPKNMDVILPTYEFIRRELAGVLPQMRPAEIIPDTPERNWCLAAGDDTFLVYALEGGAFRVDLTGAQGPYLAQWFDPRTGALTKLPSTVPGRAVAHFPAPDQQDWALLLRRSE